MIFTAKQYAAYKLLTETRENLFITGGAGTGKSFLVNEWASKQMPPVDRVASTGMAAVLINGCTFHRFFGFGISNCLHEQYTRAMSCSKVTNNLLFVDTVVIDEISMLPAMLLDAADRVCKTVRKNMLPFGGIRVITVGDFFQLPPITPDGQPVDWAFKANAWRSFKTIELTEIVRSDDFEFHKVLHDLRVGKISQESDAYLRARLTGTFNEDYTRISGLRKEADSQNNKHLEALSGSAYAFYSRTHGIPANIASLEKALPVSKCLKLKVGARVMLRYNDPDGRFVNGSTGTVESCNINAPKAITINLDNGKVVSISRKRWELFDAKRNPLASVSQYPVSLAWATTIHKAQGATIDRVLADLTNVWEKGQAYVAISRAKDPSQLAIAGYDPKKVQAHPEVLEYHEFHRST